MLVAPPGAGKTTRVPLVLARRAVGGGQEDPRAGAAPARRARRRRAHGDDARRGGRRDASAIACASARRCRAGPASRSSPRACSRAWSSTIRRSTASRRVLFDEFHERSLDADLGLALARDVQQGLREDLKLLVMSATIDGARVAKLLGDAPVIESEGRAFPVETRYLGRDPRAPIERAGRRRGGAGAARRAGLGAGLPAGRRRNPPHRDAAARARRRSRGRHRRALRRARCRRAGPRDRARAARPAQGRAGDLDRRDLAHHRRRAHRGRLRARARAALRARRRPHAARNRAGLARLRRPAPRPRRPHRAGRLLPAVGRAADRLARGLRTRRKSSPPICRRFVLDLAHWGVADPSTLVVPRSAAARRAGRGARRCSPSSARIDADGRITDEGRRAAPLPLPPRLARMVVDAAREGAGASSRPRSPRCSPSAGSAATMSISPTASMRCAATARAAPSDARAMARRWAEIARVGAGGESAQRTSPSGSSRRRRCSRSPIRTASPRTAARAARSCSPTAAAPMSIRPRRWRASRSSRSAEITGSAAQGRIVLAAPITLAEIEAQFADRIEARDEVAFDAASASLRGAALRRLGAIALAEQTDAGRAERRHRAHARRRHRARSASTACRGPRRCGNGATA